jgi:hypothetical protein
MKKIAYYPEFNYEIKDNNIELSSFIRKNIDGVWHVKEIKERYELDPEINENINFTQLFIRICLLSELYFDWQGKSVIIDSFQGSDIELFESNNTDLLMIEPIKS